MRNCKRSDDRSRTARAALVDLRAEGRECRAATDAGPNDVERDAEERGEQVCEHTIGCRSHDALSAENIARCFYPMLLRRNSTHTSACPNPSLGLTWRVIL